MTLLCLLLLFLAGSDSGQVRFEFVTNTSLVVVPVYLNGSGPYRFLLDTGATHSLLSSALAKKLALRRGRTEKLVTAGGTLAVSIRSLDALQVGDVRFDRPQIAIADFALLGTLQVDGILGGDYLKSVNLFIDYSRQFVRVESAGISKAGGDAVDRRR